MWLLPVIFNLPKIFEKGVSFEPGKLNRRENVSEIGYICYPVENGTKVTWTAKQFTFNIIQDILVLLTIIISGLISWVSFRREIHDNTEKFKHDDLNLWRSNIISKLKKKDLSLSVSIICITYIVCRFPLAIAYSSQDINEEVNAAWLQFCVVLYNVQFSLHFIIYAIFQNNYRDAYFDILRLIFPCHQKLCCSKNNNV